MAWVIHVLISDGTKDQKETRAGQGNVRGQGGVPFQVRPGAIRTRSW